MKVCSLHFKKCDYILPDIPSKKRILKKTAVPSCNLPKGFGVIDAAKNEARLVRRLRRDRLNTVIKKNDTPEEIEESFMEFIENSTETSTVVKNVKVSLDKVYSDVSIQVNTIFHKPHLINFIVTEADLSTATGIPSFKVLDTIVKIMELVYGKHLPKSQMTLKEQVIMTYVKLKQDVSYTFLALLINNCSAVQCRRIFYSTLKMLSKCLKIVVPWPSREEISKNLPECFKNFEDTRVVLDCTEIFIQSPKNLCCQELTYSNYKSSTTCKIMTGVTPGGLISFISKPYGGRSSDTAIFQQSDLLSLLEPGDAVMTDRGFLIDELCARNNWKIIRPPFLRNKKQFSKSESILTSKIAKARVHVERTNQRIKTFSILGKTMSVQLVPILEEIFTVVCATVNLSSSIFKDDKFMKN
ncbi:uncharacterized protein [Prorops nasuta]|uniref:uncharacterized protein n=1 Tax=Prorops nasuta TaxID=863751 RepID=UPI0034CD1FEE